ncbi:MAG: 50S ribosomal protein L1 [Bdellovibrionota bacterium]
MAKHGKKYRKVIENFDRNKLYPLKEAVELVQKTSYTKFDGTVDLSVNLGVDPRHADQNVRGATPLPHGLGKSVRIVVFAKGDKAVEASKEDVEFVGGDDLAEKISGGWMDFDQVVATPDMMAVVGKLGRVLGPRGLMPNPKVGTVTFDVVKAIKELKAGRAEFRVDKAGIVHTAVGKVSMNLDHLSENISAVVDALIKAKPSSAKGNYLKKIGLSATMGPGVKVDVTPFKK